MTAPAPAPLPQPRLVTAVELAQHLGVSRASIYNQLLGRGCPSVKVGTCRRFRLAEVDAWLDEADTRKVAS